MFFSGEQALGVGGFQGRLQGDHAVVMQTSASLGWSRQRAGYNIGAIYSPGYVRGVRSADFSSTSHILSVAASRNLNSKWTLDSSVRGVLADLHQLLFATPRAGEIAGLNATFEDLFSGVVSGRTDNLALASAIRAPQIAASPETSFLYGSRELSVAGAVGVSYAASTRSTYRVSGTVTRSQSVRNAGTAESGPALLIPNTTVGSLDLSWSYSLSPRTSVSAGLSSSRIISRLQDSYSSQASFSIGRTLSPKWFVSAMGGAGIVRPVRQTLSVQQSAQEIWGGSIGYMLSSHTFVASASRAVSDVYGAGANATLGANGAWGWKPRARSFSVNASFGYMRLLGPAFDYSGSLTARAGISKSLGRHSFLGVAYSYARIPQNLFLDPASLTQAGLMVSLGWSPAPRW
jgi:hypothetical protein